MDTINIILFIVLCLLIIAELVQYRIYGMNVQNFVKAVEVFNKDSEKYRNSFNDMSQAVEMTADATQGVALRQIELQEEFDRAKTVIDIHSQALNLKVLEGILTKISVE